MLNQENKKKITIGLKKASSLISKVIEMVEKDRYCIEVMQQNLAVIGLLRSAHEELMANHLDTCFRSALVSGNKKKKEAMVEEILKVNRFYNK
jgi:DNA-binding FrmR family transcriptional regulator